jgi:hypothetical protein
MPPSTGSVLWEVVGRSGLLTWCGITGESSDRTLLSLHVLEQELSAAVFTNRREAVNHANVMLGDLIADGGWMVTSWPPR